MYLLQVEDEAVFPSKIGGTFPRNFLSIAKLILKRLFRVYAHVYHQHFKEVNTHAAIVETYRSGSPGCVSRGGGAREHELEALHLLHQGV